MLLGSSPAQASVAPISHEKEDRGGLFFSKEKRTAMLADTRLKEPFVRLNRLSPEVIFLIHTIKLIIHYIYTSKKVLHHLGSTSSGTFTYKWNRDPHKQHFSSFYCSWKPHIPWCTIIQIDFQKLWSRLQYTPVPLIPSSMSSCTDAYLYQIGRASCRERV